MLLEGRNICFSYDKKKPIFNDFNISVASNERVAIVAPSGYGKTTLAKILSGYEKKFKGEVLLDNQKILTSKFNPVQLILQHPEKAVNPRWKMKKILDEVGATDRDLLASLGIETAWLNRYPNELSSGELQRFCVARALSVDTKFIIADEITAMLDVITQAQIWSYILKKIDEKNIGLILITHNKPLIKKISTRIIDISKSIL